MQPVRGEVYQKGGYTVTLIPLQKHGKGLLKIVKENECRIIEVIVQQKRQGVEVGEKIKEIFYDNMKKCLSELDDWKFRNDFLITMELEKNEPGLGIRKACSQVSPASSSSCEPCSKKSAAHADFFLSMNRLLAQEEEGKRSITRSKAFEDLQSLALSLEALEQNESKNLEGDPEGSFPPHGMGFKNPCEDNDSVIIPEEDCRVPQMEEWTYRICVRAGQEAEIKLNVFPRHQTPIPSEIVSGFVAKKIESQEVLISVNSIMDAIDFLEKNLAVDRRHGLQMMQDFLEIPRRSVIPLCHRFLRKTLISEGVEKDICALLEKNNKRSCEMLALATSSHVRIKKSFWNKYPTLYSVDERGTVSVEVTVDKFPFNFGGRKSIRAVILIDGNGHVLTNMVRLREKVKDIIGLPLSQEHIEINVRSMWQERYVMEILCREKIPLVANCFSVYRATKYGERQENLYMKRYVGGDFREYVMQHRRETDFLDSALLKMSCFLHALSAMHEHKIYHRDVKLENALIDENGIVYLADFDSTLVDGDEALREQLREIVGTCGYRPPEQSRLDLSMDGMASADMFAVGVCLLQFLPELSLEECCPFRFDLKFYIENGVNVYRVFSEKIFSMQELLQALGRSPREKKLCALISRLISLNPRDRPSAMETKAIIISLLDKQGREQFDQITASGSD